MNPNDKIRRDVLTWFHQRNLSATSQYGKNGSAVKVSDVKKGLKSAHGLSQQQVMSNLTYLIDKGWINKTEVEKTIQVKGGTVPSTVTWYEISANGIDKIEGSSEFTNGGKFAGININATGTNVVTLGDGNVVNAKFTDLHHQLSNLATTVSASNLNEEQKLDVTVDIETLKDQLVKAHPDKTILGRLWSRIEQMATIGGFADAVQMVLPHIQNLLT